MSEHEIDFEKYRKRGAYHWRNYFGSLTKIDCFLRGRYDVVISLLRKHGVSDRSVILEVGCGDGALTGLIYKNFRCELHGIDPSEAGIRFCREMFAKRRYKGSFAVSEGYSFNFPDNHFDMVVLADVIEHVQFPDKMLAEIRRVVKPSGIAIVTTPVRTSEYPEDKMHVQEFFPDQLVELCRGTFGTPADKLYSHPVGWFEFYTHGKKGNRSLVRLYMRIRDKLFGSNVFLTNASDSKWVNFKQQALVLRKR